MIRCGRILHIPSSYAAGKRLDRYGLTNSILISVCISPCGYSLVLVSGLGGSPTVWLKNQHGTCCIGDLHVSQWVIIGFYSPKSITCTHTLPLIPRHIYVCRVKSLFGTVTCEHMYSGNVRLTDYFSCKQVENRHRERYAKVPNAQIVIETSAFLQQPWSKKHSSTTRA